MFHILFLCFCWLVVPIIGCSEIITRSTEKKTDNHIMHEDMVFVKEGKFISGCSLNKCDLPMYGQIKERKGGISSEYYPDFNIAKRVVYIKELWIDKTEVTVGDYKDCVDLEICSDKGVSNGNSLVWEGLGRGCNWGEGNDRLPMNCVDWYQAKIYCEWKGKRLPKAIEWEKACRGAQDNYVHWDVYEQKANKKINTSAIGNAIDVSAYKLRPHSNSLSPLVRVYNDGYALSAPVGKYPRGISPYGAYDMLGNVSEWTDDEGKSDTREVRGGSFFHLPEYIRPWARWFIPATGRRINVGFRCAFTPQDKNSE